MGSRPRVIGFLRGWQGFGRCRVEGGSSLNAWCNPCARSSREAGANCDRTDSAASEVV